jgi:TetR/AcrR family transcriptional regulator, transcriptional repressor for nem operon
MTSRGEATRTAIMDAAEALILEQGFAATSVDRIIRRAGVTKGTFFYHFDTKQALAHALVERFSRLDLGLLEDKLAAVEAAHEDPLEQLLAFVDAFIADAEALTEPEPGCLFASYCYEAGLFDADTLDVIERTYLRWRERLGEKLGAVAKRHPPREPVSLRGLADMMTVVLEGAFVVSKTLGERGTVAEHLGHYRRYLTLLFGASGTG